MSLPIAKSPRNFLAEGLGNRIQLFYNLSLPSNDPLGSDELASLPVSWKTRKGGRVVECAGLEIQCTFRGTVSSNLTLSAKFKNPR